MLSRPFLPAAGLLLLTLVVYAPAVRGSFLWDDDAYITRNETLKDAHGLAEIWCTPGATPQYYPLVFSSFWVEYHFWELNPAGYLLVNILLHGMNAVLLWFVLRRLTVPGAWLAAALFAVHPVYVESISWIQERKNLLSGFFFFAAALAYLRFARVPGDRGARDEGRGASEKKDSASLLPRRSPLVSRLSLAVWYVLALVFAVCAFLSKTATCALPAALALVIWWQRGRLSKRDLLALAPFFALSIVSGLITVRVESKMFDVGGGAEWAFTPLERTLIAGRALWFYAWKLVWPANLAFIYPRWHIDAAVWWQYIFPAGAAAVIALLWLLRHKIGRGPLVAVLFFAGMLLPVLGFLNFYFMRFSLVADHLQYLPSAGLLALAAALLTRALRLLPRPLTIVGSFVVSISLLGTLGFVTRAQERHFKDLMSLYTDTLAKNPDCWLFHNSLANALVRQGELANAVEHFTIALRIKPDYSTAHLNFAKVLLGLKEREAATAHLREFVRLTPSGTDARRLSDARLLLGLLCAEEQRFDEAADYLIAETQDNPGSTRAFYNLGMVRLQQNKWPEACAAFEKAWALKVGEPSFHRELAKALRQLGKTGEADQQDKEAEELEGRKRQAGK